MKKSHRLLIAISSLAVTLTVFINLEILGYTTFINEANAQSGHGDYFSCAEHPDDCNSSVAGCDDGYIGIENCMIYCGSLWGPWVYCDGNSDPDPGEA